MSKVTLETLKADVKAAMSKFLALPFAERFLSDPEEAKACRRAEKIYDIARKEGLEAAMLWKLAN